MPFLGIGVKKAKKNKKTDATGYTDAQKKAMKSLKGSKTMSAIDKRRKAMAEILGN